MAGFLLYFLYKDMVKKDIYKHFKGNEYEVIREGTESEPGEKFILYRALGEEALWIRPYDVFFEEVHKPEYDYIGPRFVFVRE